MTVDLAPSRAGALVLRNPVLTASGTFGYGTEYESIFDIQRLGAIVCKTATRHPRSGNAPARIAETPSGMLNSIGLQNVGLEAVVRDKGPIWAGWQVPVIVNIAAESGAEFAEMAVMLGDVPGVAGLELNISCPNVAGGLDFGTDPVLTAEVVSAVRRSTKLPIIAKLTPNVTDIVSIARACEDAGADAVSLINTLVGMVIDIRTRRPILGTVSGGLSGPAIKPVALAAVYRVAGAVRIPVIGIGGIRTAEDALEFIMAGASAVQVGSVSFVDPWTAPNVLSGLQDWCSEEGVDAVRDLIGVGRVPPRLATGEHR
ncbi:MAG: dihydroorotate dehydrogenase [Chloroflexi bacterium]|nr:dihydroorotate dehydrogenase [Chloroflexota bacterium]